MDEEDLLLETSSAFDVSNLSELDESAILGDDDIQEEGSAKDDVVEQHEETEELDYDEDLEAEKAPRSSRFTSERALMQKRPSQNDIATKKEDRSRHEFPSSTSGSKPVVEAVVKEESSAAVLQKRSPDSTTQARAPKVFINPHHKGVIRPQVPLRWEAAVRVPSVPVLRPAVAIPLQSSVALLSQMPHSGAFPIVASSSTDFSRPPPQIMPLPNYSTPPPSIFSNQLVTESVGPLPSVGQWDQMVEGFLRRTTARSRSRFSRSSRSSFSSSRSRSRSYSSHSSSSTASTRSSSRSPYRHVHSRGRRSTSRRPLNYRSRSDVNRRRPGERSRQPNDSRREAAHHSDRNRNRANDAAKQEKTIECAKAIGLDSEYLTKLEEQKKMREEILRKKEERRIQTVQRLGGPVPVVGGKAIRPDRGGNLDGRRVEHGRRVDEERSRRREFDSRSRRTGTIRNGRKELLPGTTGSDSRRTANTGRSETEKEVVSSSTTQRMEPTTTVHNSNLQQQDAAIRQAKRENQHHPERTRKKKAYLAVVINSSNQAAVDMGRIRIIAETIGPTKKVWKSAENTVSLIFEEHESAKKFMFHYHNRVIHGVQLAVTLQKLFANLAEIP